MSEKNFYKVKDEVAASVEARVQKARFSYIEQKVKEIQEKNLPLYMDIIYSNLGNGGEKLQAEYIARFAKEHYQDLSDLHTRNFLHQKFAMLADPFQRFTYDKKFLILHPDGSFELNEKAVDDHYREKYTYQVTAEQYEAIESIRRSLETLGLHPSYVKSHYYLEGKKVKVNEVKLYALLSGGQRSEYTM